MGGTVEESCEGELCGCWKAILRAVAEQSRPGQTLGAALTQRADLLDPLLRALSRGLMHCRSGIRAASLECWEDARVQGTLGRHLTGQPFTSYALYTACWA